MTNPRFGPGTIIDAVAPPERIAAFRVLTGAFAVITLTFRWSHFQSVARFADHRFDPVGPLGWLDEPLAPGAFTVLVLAALATGIAYTTGWRFRVTGPVFAVLLLAVLTYRNSWGQTDHTENLLVLHVAVIGFSRAADAWSLDAKRADADAPSAPTAGESTRYGFPLCLAALMTVLTYFVAGVAKVRNGGFDWVAGDVLANQVAFDNARKIVLGDISSPIAGPVLGWPWLFKPMAAVSLAVELGAPLALLGRRWAQVWATSAWAFHVGILALMAIAFPYPLFGIAFAPLFALEVPARRIAALGAPRARSTSKVDARS